MAQSDCTNIANLIPLYIDKMLSDKENDIVRKHIAGCKSCSCEYEFLKSVMEKTRCIPEIEVSKDFHEKLMTKIKKERKPGLGGKYRILSRRSLVGAAAAAAVIAVSVVSYINLDGSSNFANPDEFISREYYSEQPEATYSQSETDSLRTDTETGDEHKALNGVNKALNRENKSVEPGNEISPSQSKSNDSTGKADVQKNDILAQSSADSENDGRSNLSEEFGETEKIISQPLTTGESSESSIPVFDVSNADNDSQQEAAHSQNENGDSEAHDQRSVGRSVSYRVFYVSVSDEEMDTAKKLLHGYTEDERGYRMEQDASDVLYALSNLKGYQLENSAADAELDSDYIVLQEK